MRKVLQNTPGNTVQNDTKSHHSPGKAAGQGTAKRVVLVRVLVHAPPQPRLAGIHLRHTSHVTRHTSHVTRHTSHVTRHTLHNTCHMSHSSRSHLAAGVAVVRDDVPLLHDLQPDAAARAPEFPGQLWLGLNPKS